MTQQHAVRPGGGKPSVGERRSLGQRTFDGMIWMSAKAVGQVLVQVVVLAVLARHVSQSDFGVAAAALAVLALAVVLADLGLGPAIVQRKDLRPDHIRVAFTVVSLLGLLLWLLLIAIAPGVASLFEIPRLEPALRVIGAVLFVRGLTVGDHLLQRELDFRRLAAVELAALVIGYGTVSIILALFGAGVWAIVWGHLAQAILRTVLLWAVRPHPWLPSLARGPLGELVRFGAGLSVGQLAAVVATQADNFIVGRWLGSTALGLYGRAYQLMAMPAFLFGQVANQVLFPAMALVQDDKVRLRRAYETGVACVAVLTLPLSVVLAVSAREVILVILGADWLPLQSAFEVLAFGMFFRTGYKISDCLALATGAIYRRSTRQWMYAALVVLGSLVGQRWGIFGVAVGVAMALAVNYLLTAQLSLRLIEMSWRRFLVAHGAGVALSSVVTAAAWPTATTLRGAGAPATVVVAGTLCASSLAALTGLRFAPRVPAMTGMVELVESITGMLGSHSARTLIHRVAGWRGRAHGGGSGQ